MWLATVLPHCGHLLNCGRCQRFAALRVRSRILDVLRLGTPMAGGYKSTLLQKNNGPPATFGDTGLPIHDATILDLTFLDLQLIQRAPVGLSFRLRCRGYRGSRFTNASAFAVTARVRR